MAINQQGIAIVIKAFLPTGKTLDEQFNALSIVKTAHETGDYSPLLAASQDVEVKTEQKTRRIEEPAAPEPAPFVPTECNDAPVGLTGLPETAPEGEPSLQDVADYGVDHGAGMASKLTPKEIATAEAGPDEGQADWLAQPEQPAPEAAPEQQPARARRKVNGNE